MRYSSVVREGTTFAVAEGSFSGKKDDDTPFKTYVLLASAEHRGVPLTFVGAVNLLKSPAPAAQVAAVKVAFASFRLI